MLPASVARWKMSLRFCIRNIVSEVLQCFKIGAQAPCGKCLPPAVRIFWMHGGLFAAAVGFQRFNLPTRRLPVTCTGCSSNKTRRQVMTLDAAQLRLTQAEGLSVTQTAYIGDPLYQFHGVRKGRLFQQAISQTLVSSPYSKLQREATSGLRVNGSRRSAHQSEFDFMHGERRVECKGASLAWMRHRSWFAQWCNIKFDLGLFDDLFLALHSPGRIDVILHDGVTGRARSGVRTVSHGHAVRGKPGLPRDPGQNTMCPWIMSAYWNHENGQHVYGWGVEEGTGHRELLVILTLV